MVFNSFVFVLFLPVVLGVFILTKRPWRWIVLLIASYFFYGYWKTEYLGLIFFSTLADYQIARKIYSSSIDRNRRLLLYTSLFLNLGILFFFKYFNFVNNSISEIGQQLGSTNPLPYSDFLLPVGISFYTFQTLSYTIDVYNRKIDPEKHFGHFALFVTFFPQLVAGPIERAGNLLSQLKEQLVFKPVLAREGAKLILWGLFKKVVIADRLALLVDSVYNAPDEYGSIALTLATLFFALQIYCDFSGYSDIAIGVARLFGVKLMKNFDRPYLATSINEFWKRWHISLSTWFRDYVYIPLGGNRVVIIRWYVNLLITFLISGLWHGANWTFVIWGALHGLYLLLEIQLKISSDSYHGATKIFGRVLTFTLVSLAWVFFRANSVSDAINIYASIFSFSDLDLLIIVDQIKATGISKLNLILSFGYIVVLFFIENFNVSIQRPSNTTFYRWLFYYFLFFSIIFFGVDGADSFIYFQF